MANLAINGGTPLLARRLQPRWPIFGEAEKEGLLEVLHSGRWCSMGNSEGKVAQFERSFARFIGTEYATAVPTGTDALELAFRSCGLEAGDEVIVPAVTFIASASAVVLASGVPVFVDVDPETYQISPEAAEAAITSRTRAIEVVHYGGYPADMDRIMEIAEKHGLLVVEDCAEAHGSEWRGKKVGSFGSMGCFSFQMGKPLTCGEGGAVTYSDEELALQCYSWSRLGRRPGGEQYEHHIPAGNFRMSEFLGAILLSQLDRLEEQTRLRHENGEYLAHELEKIEGISALKRDPRVTGRGYYFYFMRYDSSGWNQVHRDRFMAALEAEGIPCGTAHSSPLYRNPAFRDIKKSLLHRSQIDYSTMRCPEAERIYANEVVALTKDLLLQKEDVDKVLEGIVKLRENLDELSAPS